MDARNETACPPNSEGGATRSVSWWEKPFNIVTLGYWGRLNKGEKRAFVVSWNLSSWVTIGQVTGGAWVWSKLSAAAPWLAPLIKGVWTKVSAGVAAVAHAVTHA